MIGLELLAKIGIDLDEGIGPVVHVRGVVEPGRPHDPEVEPGRKEIEHERQDSGRPAIWPRGGTTGGAWPPGGPTPERSRETSAASSIIGELTLTDARRADLEGVVGAYPQVTFRPTPGLIWLLNHVEPIRGLNQTALIVTAYPLESRGFVASWAWWGPGLIWIGPRHTNYFPSGSICSYEPRDGTWHEGKSLTSLLDLQVVWIVRHLFLSKFGRWPGQQIFHTEWERLNEHLPGELCGGCESGRKYEQCCQPVDKMIKPVDRLINFIKWSNRTIDRKPPAALSDFVFGRRKSPPLLNELQLMRTESYPSLLIMSQC